MSTCTLVMSGTASMGRRVKFQAPSPTSSSVSASGVRSTPGLADGTQIGTGVAVDALFEVDVVNLVLQVVPGADEALGSRTIIVENERTSEVSFPCPFSRRMQAWIESL